MNSYEAVFCRRSVRKFRMEPVAADVLDKIRKFSANVTPLDGSSRVEFDIYEHIDKKKDKVRGMWKREAPYYLLVYCEDTPGAHRNAGYMAEQVVLYLTIKELGSCYLGETKIGLSEKNGLKRLLVIAFGYAQGALYRTIDEAHRFPLSGLCVFKDEPGENMKKILKASRLAPSSFNSQPWRFVVYADRIYVFAKKTMASGYGALAAMRDFNMGIVLSHIMLAAEEFWMNMETVTDEQFLKKSYKNGDYICTIVFHN